MPSAAYEVYPIHRSPFWHMGRQRDLAHLARMDLKALHSLARGGSDHYWTREEEIEGKKRIIVCPYGRMRSLHDTLKGLLGRIQQPEYLYSPRRRYTPHFNTYSYCDSKIIIKLDIRKFYPSTTSEHVFRFFRYDMGMADDVAGLLTKLCTENGKIAFGSPLSPVLCALVHRRLFDRIFRLTNDAGLTGTLWVDDITISGNTIPQGLLFRIKREIVHHRLKYHKVRHRDARAGIPVTGLYVSERGIAPANKTFKKLRLSISEMESTKDLDTKIKLIESIIGQCRYIHSIYPENHWSKMRIEGLLVWLHNFRRSLSSSNSALPEEDLSARLSEGAEVPWDCAITSPRSFE